MRGRHGWSRRLQSYEQFEVLITVEEGDLCCSQALTTFDACLECTSQIHLKHFCFQNDVEMSKPLLFHCICEPMLRRQPHHLDGKGSSKSVANRASSIHPRIISAKHQAFQGLLIRVILVIPMLPGCLIILMGIEWGDPHTDALPPLAK